MSVERSVLEKIKKLFALAADPNNPHEAASAASKAQELLLKHKLSTADVASSIGAAPGIVEVDLSVTVNIRKQNWARYLALNVARHHFCVLLTTPEGFRFVGTLEDIDVAVWLYEFLEQTINRLADEAYTREKALIERIREKYDETDAFIPPKHTRTSGIKWKNDFRLGASATIEERLKRQRYDFEQTAIQSRREEVKRLADQAWRNGTDLRMISRQYTESWEQTIERALAPWREAEEKVRRYVDEAYPNLESEPDIILEVDDDSAFIKGKAAGHRIHLHRPS